MIDELYALDLQQNSTEAIAPKCIQSGKKVFF